MKTLAAGARTLGIELSDGQLGLFDSYAAELASWNERTNLTAITAPEEVALKHFLDSLTVFSAFPPDALTIIDIGSGAGFPGIPLKIARPELEVTLLEATAKKVEFLEHVIKTLKLEGISAVHGRAEDLGRNSAYRERFDIAAARAVAELATLAELALPFLKIGGTFIAQKSASAAVSHNEVESARTAIQELGGGEPKIAPLTIPELPDRLLVCIEKIAPTPEKYPRRAGIPAKRPI